MLPEKVPQCKSSLIQALRCNMSLIVTCEKQRETQVVDNKSTLEDDTVALGGFAKRLEGV